MKRLVQAGPREHDTIQISDDIHPYGTSDVILLSQGVNNQLGIPKSHLRNVLNALENFVPGSDPNAQRHREGQKAGDGGAIMIIQGHTCRVWQSLNDTSEWCASVDSIPITDGNSSRPVRYRSSSDALLAALSAMVEGAVSNASQQQIAINQRNMVEERRAEYNRGYREGATLRAQVEEKEAEERLVESAKKRGRFSELDFDAN